MHIACTLRNYPKNIGRFVMTQLFSYLEEIPWPQCEKMHNADQSQKTGLRLKQTGAPTN